MRRLFANRPSPALVIALIALFVSLGGVSYGLTRNSVGTNAIANNSVRSSDIRNGTIQRRDVKRDVIDNSRIRNGTLTADVANDAYSAFANAERAFPDGYGTILTLVINKPGAYVINAKTSAFNTSGVDNNSSACRLLAGTALDLTGFDVAGDPDSDEEVVVLQAVQNFNAPARVLLQCRDEGQGDVVGSFSKLTAHRVRAASRTAG